MILEIVKNGFRVCLLEMRFLSPSEERCYAHCADALSSPGTVWVEEDADHDGASQSGQDDDESWGNWTGDQDWTPAPAPESTMVNEHGGRHSEGGSCASSAGNTPPPPWHAASAPPPPPTKAANLEPEPKKAPKAASKAAHFPPSPPSAASKELLERIQRKYERAKELEQEALRKHVGTARLPGTPQVAKLLAPFLRQSSANYDAVYPPALPQPMVPGDSPQVTGVFITEMIKD